MTDDGRFGARRVDLTRVLVVEDSEEDAEAIERALTRTHPALSLEFTAHGDGLAERLLARHEELPGMVLLDLNMPGAGGLKVLTALRARPELAELTVVVFTSSTAPAEVDACYAAGADSYIYKPVNFDLFRTVLKGAVDYWQQAKGQPPAAPGSPRVK
ncbi:response regulator [Streptomyces albidoflavus]|uniref:response regulator n=1 Tax=Streptomyces albidoflavus TaxID=1886 RepID=UPI0002F2A256